MCPRAPDVLLPTRRRALFSEKNKVSARRNWAPRQANRDARAFRPTESPNRETSGTISLAEVVLANRFLAVLRTCFGRDVMSPRGDARGPLPHSLHKHQTEKMAFCLSASTSTSSALRSPRSPPSRAALPGTFPAGTRTRSRGCFPNERCAVCPDGRRRVRSARRDAIGTDAPRTTRRSRRDGPRSTGPDSRATRRAPRRSRRRRGGGHREALVQSRPRGVALSSALPFFALFLFAFFLAAT